MTNRNKSIFTFNINIVTKRWWKTRIFELQRSRSQIPVCFGTIPYSAPRHPLLNHGCKETNEDEKVSSHSPPINTFLLNNFWLLSSSSTRGCRSFDHKNFGSARLLNRASTRNFLHCVFVWCRDVAQWSNETGEVGQGIFDKNCRFPCLSYDNIICFRKGHPWWNHLDVTKKPTEPLLNFSVSKISWAFKVSSSRPTRGFRIN